MKTVFESALLVIYFVPACILMLFGMNLYYNLFLFISRKKTAKAELDRLMTDFGSRFTRDDLPLVVTQLPLYNEYNVAERVIRAAADMDYPPGKHIVQVLDDSTDETKALVDRVAAELHATGKNVQVVRRPTREGFKAGALSFGMTAQPADFYAIFDADFVPTRDFLTRTVPVMMMRSEVGLVQARWGHLNAGTSVITQAQGIGIDAHFAIEQPARSWNNLFMNFNGTAGLWRRSAIEEGGGWEHDTLTEDMDLSYRAQLAGWKPFYLFDLVVPAEVPDNINAFKAQQFRWAKGSMQTAVKLLPRIFASSFPRRAKIQAFFHMAHYIIHPLMVTVAFMALPVLKFTRFGSLGIILASLFTLLILSTFAPLSVYAYAQCVLYEKGWKRIRFLPFLTSLGIGIALSNSRAVIEALTGVESAFIRTPKKGTLTTHYYHVRFSRGALVELSLGLYCFITFFFFLDAHKYLVIPFFLLYASGFTVVGILSILHFLHELRWARELHHA